SPASRAVGPSRRSPLVRFGVPVVLGGLAALAALAVVLGIGLGGPVLALAAAAGVGAVTLGGVGVAANRPLPAAEARPVLDASVPDSTRAVLEEILSADAAIREQVTGLRPQASSTPTATSVLDHVEALVTRIDALVGAEQLQSLRPSSGEVTMLEGIACRYVPDLVDAAADTIGFLRTFEGTARQEALENLASVDQQLNVLAEGVEQIEADLVGGVSRSLEVHAEFLRARFADQHLNPIIDVCPPCTFPPATAQEAPMNKLEPPTPAQEITPAEPVESIDDDQAGDMLPDLAPEQQAELEQRADAWVEQVAQLNPHSQEYTAQVNALGAVARRTFERTSQTSSRFMQQSLRESKEKGNAQESVAKSLSELRTTMEDLAPKDETFADKALGWLPGRN